MHTRDQGHPWCASHGGLRLARRCGEGKIHAPPLEGRANEALTEFLADELDLPRRAVSLVRGDTARQKVVRIDGLALDEVKRRLGL